MYVRMYVCTYVRRYVCMYVCMYVRTYYARTYVCMYVRAHVRMYVCVCVCVCVLSIYPSIRPSVRPSTYLPTYLPTNYLSIFVSSYLSVCLSPYATPNANSFHWCHNSPTEQSVPLCDLQGISSSNGKRSNRNSSMHSRVVYRCRLSQVPQYLRQTAVSYPDNGGSSKMSVPLCQTTRCHILKRNTDRCFATVNSTA
jgi:hypothetical protein